ncbi:MAG: Mur ligase family protein, partial [Promicromonosporaceae bacterium]|nr:Mur ligase family protein [Promicromonosporaceae bacterium]
MSTPDAAMVPPVEAMPGRITPASNEGMSFRDLGLAVDAELHYLGGVDNPQVTAVVSDNRQVKPGALFAALPGATVHGAQFAADAIARGAAAVLTDEAGLFQLIHADLEKPVMVVPNPRAAVGLIAARVYGDPAKNMTTFGMTGTNGKTTVTYLLDAIARALGRTTGLIGTVEMRSAGRVLPSKLTTPEAADLQALLAAMAEDGVTSLAMEVSSHSLALGRVNGICYDVSGFTNLTQDHLDFHGTMENYYQAKAGLFTERSRQAVVVVDDEWGQRLAVDTRQREVPTTTISSLPNAPVADWIVTDVTPHDTGSAFTLTHTDGRCLRTSVSLPGFFNVT